MHVSFSVKKWSVFLLVAALLWSTLAVCGGGSALAADAKKPVKLTLGHILPETVEHSAAIRRFCDRIAERTGGRITIEAFSAGILGSEMEMIEQMRMGSTQIVIPSLGSLAALDPKMAIEDLPYMWKTNAHARAAFDGAFGRYLMDLMAAKGLVPLGFVEWGYRNMTTNKVDASHPKNLTGLKIRVAESPLRVEVFEAYGAQPVVMSFSEVYAALQQGVIDGQENPLPTVVNANLYEVQENLTLTGHFFTSLMGIVNPQTWASFSEEEQKIFREEMATLTQETRDACDNLTADLLATCRATFKNVVDTVDKDAYREAAKGVYEKWGQKVFGEELMKLYTEASGW